MLCQNCGEREANVHLSQSINGQTRELHLCDQCAKKTQGVNFVFHQGLGMPDFLQALLGFNPAVGGERAQEEACPGCGMTFSQISHAGKLGCAACYAKFERNLEPVLRRIHGGGSHEGKVPKRRGAALRSRLELKKLKEKLRLLVQQEHFEEAAQVRDEIRRLEQAVGGSKE